MVWTWHGVGDRSRYEWRRPGKLDRQRSTCSRVRRTDSDDVDAERRRVLVSESADWRSSSARYDGAVPWRHLYGIIGKRIAKRLWVCVNAERQHLNTCCNCWYRKTFYYSGVNTVWLPDLPFLFIRQYQLWNDAQLRIVTVTRFSWYFAANTTVF